MKIGFIGAGRAGCSLGKYFMTRKELAGLEVVGYYSLVEEEARWAAEYTDSVSFQSAEEVVAVSDTVIISTPDGAIKNVWESLCKENIEGKMFCHLSGSLSSDVFSGVEGYGAYPLSIHPMFAFSNKESVYQQLNEVGFTLEGDTHAVLAWKDIFHAMGNQTIEISKEAKGKYHAAASILSNHVVAVLEAGYELLGQCGFSEQEARKFTSVLVKNNVEHVIEEGSMEALTGPIERADVQTVKKHLAVMDAGKREIYCACGKELVEIAKKKNPGRKYHEIENMLFENQEDKNEEYSNNI